MKKHVEKKAYQKPKFEQIEILNDVILTSGCNPVCTGVDGCDTDNETITVRFD